MRIFLTPVTLLCFLHEAVSFSFPLPNWGRCPSLPVVQGFNISGYMGTWFIQSGYNLAMTQGDGRCGYADYNYDHIRKIVEVFNNQISTKTDEWVNVAGTAEPVDPSKDEGKLKVTLNLKYVGPVTAPLWILGTDYKTYSVAYGCENFFFLFHYYSTWVLSREQTLEDPQDFYKKVDKVLLKNNIDPSSLKEVDQKKCDV